MPLWRNIDLIAREPAAQPPSFGDAQRFAEGIAARLGIIADDYVQPAFEDPADRMLKQGALPVNIDPGDPKIDDPQERARILRMFESQLTQPAGFVLPVQRWAAQAKSGWLSEVWRTRRGQVVPDPWRFPARIAPAAAVAALYRARGLSASGAG